MRLLPFLLVLGCSSAPHKPEPIPLGDYTYTIDYLQWRIEGLMDEYEIPGLAVALVDGQEVVWLGSWGETALEGGEPVTEDTVWRVGSITKVVTAVEVMRLVEEGAVDLDAPITEILPDFSVRTREEDPAPVTARHLLAHRAGVPRNSGLPTWYWDPGTDVLQAQARELSLWYAAHPVGTRYHYSNAGYVVLAALVEQVRGELWVPWVHEELLPSLGMHDSALLLQDVPEGLTVAVGHAWEDGVHEPVPQGDLITLASGNLYATVPDLASLARSFFRDGQPLLQADTVASMFEDQFGTPRDPQPQGLGWFTTDRRLPEPVVFHTGTNQGTESMLALAPGSEVGVVVVANSTRFADLYGDLVVEALELMLETKTGDLPLEEEREEVQDVDEETLDRLVGRYVCGDELLPVYRKGKKLKVDFGGVSLRLLPLGGDRFRPHHWLGDPGDLEVFFAPGEAGEQDLMVVDLLGMEHRICPRYPDVDAVPALWEEIAGEYTVVPRVESAWFEGDDLGTLEVAVEEDALHLGGLWLWPLDEAELLVIGGQWDGETVLRDPATGELTFQHEVDVPRGD